MSYNRINFTDNVTPLSANNFNNLDLAIYLINNTFTTTGSANAYLLTIPGLSSMSDLLGIPLKIKTNFAITGACTINPNSYGAYPLKKDVSSAMASGDIQNGQIIIVVWDGTNFQFVGGATGAVTTGGTQTLTNKTLTMPKIDKILDTVYGLATAVFSGVALAVNYLIFKNSATGSALEIDAAGTDSNIDINFVTKGTGLLKYNGNEILSTASPANRYGKYSQMSGGSALSGSAQSGIVSFSVEDNDDFSAINLGSSASKITISSGVTRARFYWNGIMDSDNYTGSQSVTISLRKNGTNIQTLAYTGASAHSPGGPDDGGTRYSMPVSCVAGDYFEVYAALTTSSRSTSIQAGSIFGMEVLK